MASAPTAAQIQQLQADMAALNVRLANVANVTMMQTFKNSVSALSQCQKYFSLSVMAVVLAILISVGINGFFQPKYTATDPKKSLWVLYAKQTGLLELGVHENADDCTTAANEQSDKIQGFKLRSLP